MKKFLLTNLLALATLCAGAQTDVTKYFLSNYGFDENFDYTSGQWNNVTEEIKEVKGWTADLSAGYTIVGTYEFGFLGWYNGATVPEKGYDRETGGGLGISTGWEQTFLFYQTVTLPAGTYTVNVPTYNGSDRTAATSQVAWIPASGTAVRSKVTSYPIGQWILDQITFTLTKTTTGKIQFGMKAAANGSANSAKLLIDYVQLLGENMTVDKSMLESTIASANNYYGNGTGNEATALKSAIDEAQDVVDNSSADLIAVLDAIENLNTAIAAYRKQNVSEENPEDCTFYIKNPSFEDGFTNWTQAGLQTQTNSDFKKKAGGTYVEKWTGSGSVGSASVSQTITNLPNGLYKLTVGAMNFSQSNTTKKNTGAYIYAGDAQETVYTPDDYSVKFTSIAGEVEIGFVASSASGNWIAVDNFRLYRIGDVDPEIVVTELSRKITEAETLKANTMSSTASTKLQSAIDAAKLITTESNDEDVQKASQNLKAAIAHANTSIAEYKILAQLIATAKRVEEKKMSETAVSALKSAIGTANLISASSTDDDVEKASTALSAATNDAQVSIDAYQSLSDQLADAEKAYDESKKGAAELKTALDNAKSMYDEAIAAPDDVNAEVVVLNKAILTFQLANATAGTGTAPKVTFTHPYVATGATEALMRATMTGSNILERGVCWSTEHDPTVLDNRTTQYYTLKGYIFHLTGLQPATVYYVRPYVMNKTYTVAYGDEVKIVTHPKGTCTWSWDEGAPTEAANARCRKAMEETIAYFNEWTGIKGFHLSGHYGAQTPTADCSYGGWMRIGPNAAYQAIGTVLHETGHGVGVGTMWRWYNCAETRQNTTYGKWLGREANDVLHFLENYEGDEVFFTGDGVHGWGTTASGATGNASISYDWLVNGADKDKHTPIQYIGGMCILHGLFIDGLCPTENDPNGIAGYTYNFDEAKKYYLMNKNKDRGLSEGLLYQRTATAVGWKPCLTGEVVDDSAAWYMEYNPNNGFYMFKNAATGKYLTHASQGSNVTLKEVTTPGATERFQLMPDRTDVKVTYGTTSMTTHGYWFTWYNGENKSMSANAYSNRLGYGAIAQTSFDYSDSATAQQWIIISEDELDDYQTAAVAAGISTIKVDEQSADGSKKVVGIYTPGGVQLKQTQTGFNIIKYSDGTSKRIYVK